MTKIKVGDLVMSKGGNYNGYSFTNDGALMLVTDEEGCEIEVKIIAQENNHRVGNVFWVKREKFELYKNGVLKWLHKRGNDE